MQNQQSQNKGEVLEFDLKALSDKKCRELERYVNSCLKVLQSQHKAKQNQPAGPGAGAGALGAQGMNNGMAKRQQSEMELKYQ